MEPEDPSRTAAPSPIEPARPASVRPYMACLDIADQLCVVVGGGTVAARKVTALLESAAYVRVVSPALSPTLATLATAGRIGWTARGYQSGDLDGALLVFAATGDPATNRQVARDAADRGLLANIADAPNLGSFTVPATLQRGDLIVAISTGGGAPGYARRLRDELAAIVDPAFGEALELYASVRSAILAASGERQPSLWDDLFALNLPAMIRTQGYPAAERALADWCQRRALT